ncbi:MAG: hypothetical protein N2491_04460 [Negativicutes bacterium]|nr:hypothetical protein [Negativicutes bacterium]
MPHLSILPREVVVIRTRFCCCILLAVIVLLSAVSGIALADADKVDAVTVSVTSTGAAPPPRVVQRMQASISTVGEHVLSGKKIADIAQNKSAYEKIVQEVFDRVLVGYSVQQVAIIPGATSEIRVTVAPWGDVVHDVTVELDLSAISPELHQLVRKDIGPLEERISGVLIGLPTDAVDWAGGVSKSVIRELLAAELPEFKANLDVISGQRTQVRLALMPVGPTIQDIKVTLRSNTIPNILLWETRPRIEETAKLLRGLPAAFVERHQQYFYDQIRQNLRNHPATRRYGLTVTPVIKAGTNTEVNIVADTTRYKVSLEGYLDIDKEDDNIAAKLHTGKAIGKFDELFLDITLLPGSMTWRFEPGWGRQIGASTTAGLKYDLTANHEILWLNQVVDPRWSLRLERTPDTRMNEVGLRYRLHEFLSAEYVMTNGGNWIRLVGNL